MKTMFWENCLRIALIAFNFIFAFLSIALIALSIIYSDKLSNLKLYLNDLIIKFPTLLLILGVLSFVISLFGCFCVRSTKRRYFIVFSLVLFVVLALELSISVIAFLNINQDVENNTKRLMVEQITSSNDTDKDNFHKIEQLFQCCGINNASDYVENVWPTIADFYCCGMLNCMEELQNNNESDIWFQPGCSNKVGKDIKQVVIETATVGTVCSVLQVLENISVFVMQSRLPAS